MKLPLVVGPDDGGVFGVDQIVALQLDEFLPDILGRLLVRIADNAQVAPRSTSFGPESALAICKRDRAGSRAHQQIG
jgi:hypothetical protein